jgi:hypothetical protein
MEVPSDNEMAMDADMNVMAGILDEKSEFSLSNPEEAALM